jgi:mannose-6-phosphate isomerase-like protein (cupin superfamily)
MHGRTWLDEIEAQYREHRSLCEKAAAQVPDADFFTPCGRAPLGVGVLMKHVGGNLRSRWRDFLTTDGEKADRNRDEEFRADGETRASIIARWNEGWEVALRELRALGPEDLGRTVTIRGEPHPVPRAILRNLTHVAYHCGQIVLVARHLAGERWKTLSVPPGRSEEHNAAMREKHGDWSARAAGPPASAGPARAAAAGTAAPPRRGIVLLPGQGRDYPMGRIRALFKADGDETRGRSSVSEWWLEPHTRGPGAHSHEEEDDAFFVIEGTMSFLIGDRWVDAPAGSFVMAPAGVAHDFENRSDRRAGALNLSVPGDFEKHMPAIAEWFAENPPGDA